MAWLLFAIVIGPPLLSDLLDKTPIWWVPSGALVLAGFFELVTRPSAHDAIGALGSGVQLFLAMSLIVYGLVTCAIASSGRRARL